MPDRGEAKSLALSGFPPFGRIYFNQSTRKSEKQTRMLAEGVILQNPMEIVKHPRTKKCEGHRALEPWKRKLICSTYQEHPFGLCAMVMMLSGLLCAKQNGGLMSETAFQNRFSSYLCFLETQVIGCHKRWYGQTKAHKALPVRGEQPPPWREVKIRCHDFRVDFCIRAYEAEIPVKTLQAWMGHEDVTMIMEVYAKFTKEREKIDAERLTRFMAMNLSKRPQSKAATAVAGRKV